MGRCGTLHEWEQEDVVPDIQTVAKGLAGGFAPMAGMFINHRVSAALTAGTGYVADNLCIQNSPKADMRTIASLRMHILTKDTLWDVLLH